MITIALAGRIGKNAETRNLSNGDPVTSFSVGCNAGKDKTVWVNCAIFGDRGPKLAQYLTKGTSVAITGRPSARGWQKQGSSEVNADLQCAVDQISLLGSKSDSQADNSGGGYGGGYGGGSAPQGKPPMGGPSDLDDEIPFGPEVR